MLELQIEELLLKGPFKAKNAVTVNRKVPLEVLKSTPMVCMRQGFLEYIVRSSGKIEIVNEEFTIPNIGEIIKLMYCWPGIDFYIPAYKGESAFARYFIWTRILAEELGYIKPSKNSLEITEKGLEIVRGTKIRTCYFRALTKMTDYLDWFYPLEIPEALKDIQNWVGLTLLVLSKMATDDTPVRTRNLVKAIDSITGDLEYFHHEGIRKSTISQVMYDYYIAGYGYYFGLATIEDKNCFYPTSLVKEIFEWRIPLAGESSSGT